MYNEHTRPHARPAADEDTVRLLLHRLPPSTLRRRPHTYSLHKGNAALAHCFAEDVYSAKKKVDSNVSNNRKQQKKSGDLAHRQGPKSYATLLTLRYASEVRMKWVKNHYFYI